MPLRQSFAMPQMVIKLAQGTDHLALDGMQGKAGYFGDLIIGHRI
jgi:hypothetical protein